MKYNSYVPLKYFLSFLLIFPFFLFPKMLSAEMFYFSDDFDDGNNDGWQETYLSDCNNFVWEIDSLKRYGIVINDTWGCKTQSILNSIEIPLDVSYTFELDMTFANSPNMDRNFYVKYINDERWYGFHFVGNTIFFEKVLSGVSYINPFPDVTYPFEADQTYHFKTTIDYDQITLQITNNLGVEKNFFYHDTDPILSNKFIGLRASTGEIRNSEVWFDNIELYYEHNNISNHFNLPVDYVGRDNSTQFQFQNAFWNKMTASFDHNRFGNRFQPFTGTLYTKKDCPNGTLGITCYDSHNGTDFKPSVPGSHELVFPTADGEVVYTSETGSDGLCIPNVKGYGCVMVLYHPQLDIYTLYAHLSEILKNPGDLVTYKTSIAKMGNTGCSPKCGVHIHLGVMKNISPTTVMQKMKASDWKILLNKINPSSQDDVDMNVKHYCTYTAPNGMIFSFQDPSGWGNTSISDPWAQPANTGCKIESPYLWNFDIGTTFPNNDIEGLWLMDLLN